MSPPSLTPEKRAIALAKRKAYQKEYHKTMPIEVKRKYQRALDQAKTKARQERIRAKRKALSGKTNIPLYKIATQTGIEKKEKILIETAHNLELN